MPAASYCITNKNLRLLRSAAEEIKAFWNKSVAEDRIPETSPIKSPREKSSESPEVITSSPVLVNSFWVTKSRDNPNPCSPRAKPLAPESATSALMTMEGSVIKVTSDELG